jgi:hypothetical protein
METETEAEAEAEAVATTTAANSSNHNHNNNHNPKNNTNSSSSSSSSTIQHQHQHQHQHHRHRHRHRHPHQPTSGGMSVQDQFATLSQDRDQFKYEKEQATREITTVQNVYEAYQKELADLVTSNYQAQAGWGDQTNTVKLLTEERDRIHRLIHNEGRALQDCVDYTKTLEQKEVQNKKGYIEEMQSMNDEMTSILDRRMKNKIEEYVIPQSVSDVVTTYEKQHHCTLGPIKEPYNELVLVTQLYNDKLFQLLQLQEQVHDQNNDNNNNGITSSFVDEIGDVIMEQVNGEDCDDCDDDYDDDDDYDFNVGNECCETNNDVEDHNDDVDIGTNGAYDGNDRHEGDRYDDKDDKDEDVRIDDGNGTGTGVDGATEMMSTILNDDEVVQGSEQMDLFYGPQP